VTIDASNPSEIAIGADDNLSKRIQKPEKPENQKYLDNFLDKENQETPRTHRGMLTTKGVTQ